MICPLTRSPSEQGSSHRTLGKALLPSVSPICLDRAGAQPTSSTWQRQWTGHKGEGAWRASNRGHSPLQRGPRSPDSVHTQDPSEDFCPRSGLELASPPGSTRGATAQGSLLLQHRLAPLLQRPSLADGSGPRKQMQISQPPTG